VYTNTGNKVAGGRKQEKKNDEKRRKRKKGREVEFDEPPGR